MSGVDGSDHTAVSDWDAYWLNARSAAAHKEGGPQDEVLEKFWLQLFKQVIPAFHTVPRMLDIACGNGAVARFALTALGSFERSIDLQITGLDESTAALEEMRKRCPNLEGIAGHASHLPFQDEAFDLVTSQFGLEYAGPDAIAEAARVAAPGGVIALVLHLHGGGIYRECAMNLEAIEGFRNGNLLRCFAEVFSTAQGVQEGRNSNTQFRCADKSFAQSVGTVETVFKRWGKHVADGMLFRLYSDIAYMYRHFTRYDPAEVFAWIERMAGELDSYAGRMSSMLRASLDTVQLDQATSCLAGRGVSIRLQDTLHMGRKSVPSAWVVIAERPES
jgi:ubiquinone/menaquinone biosynthesis C-methylase UbiE